jgi:cell division protein FtsB
VTMFEQMARKYGVIAFFSALVFAIFFSQNGVLDYIKLRKQVDAKEVSTRRLEEENVKLQAEINRLQKDDQYLEDMARKRFGFIKEGEKVYRIEK